MPTLTFSPAFGPLPLPSHSVHRERSIRISPQACSAVVLTLNAYQGAFTREHLARLRQFDRDAMASRELAPLISAVEHAGAVHVHFVANESARRRRT